MALYGQGDPRWLVQERADGTNVNNWHWVEKDVLGWCQHRLSELLAGKELMDPGSGMSFKVTGLDSMTGEAIINNRKGKIIPAYELETKLNWEGTGSDGKAARGKLHLPYIADENHDEEPELRVVCESDDPTSRALKDAFLQGPGKKTVSGAVQQFVKELRAGGPAHSEGEGEAKPAPAAASKPKLSSADPREVAAAAAANGSSKSKGSSTKGKGQSLQITENFYARPTDIFECFTAEGRVKAFTQSNASVEPKVGGRFSWFGGSVQGEFTELEPGKHIAMRWRFSTWEDACFSTAVLDLSEPEPGHTVLKLSHTDIPEADKFGNEDVLENVEKGWRIQIFLRIRQVFGYGLGL